MKRKKKKQIIKEKLKNIINSYKTIIYISLVLNIILVILCYNIMSSNKIYTFSGNDDYLTVSDGLIILNNDLNILKGNSIKYTYNTDYDIKSYKIGYYVMKNDKLTSIIESKMELDTEIKLSDIIANFTSFNITENNKSAKYFTKQNKKLLNHDLYLVLEAKTTKNETILSKVKLNVSKISKF